MSTAWLQLSFCLMSMVPSEVSATPRTLRRPTFKDMNARDAAMADEVKHVEKLVMGVVGKGSGTKSYGDMTDMKDDITKLITKLFDEVQEDHDHAQASVEEFRKHIETCNNVMQDKKGTEGIWATFEVQYGEAKELFQQKAKKREDTMVAVTACDDDVATKKILKNTKCTADALTEPIPTGCPMAAEKENQGDFLARMLDHYADKKKIYGEAKGQCDVATGDLTTAETACSEKKVADETNGGDVDLALTTVEHTACGWATQVQNDCEQHGLCYEEAFTAWKTAKDEALDHEKTRKNSYQMLKRLECLAGAIEGSTNEVDREKLDDCADMPAYDTDHLNLDLKDAPDKENCPLETKFPCSAEYRMDIYGSVADSVAATLRECSRCPAITGPAPPSWAPTYENAECCSLQSTGWWILKSEWKDCSMGEGGSKMSLKACEDECANSPSCVAIEYGHGDRCDGEDNCKCYLAGMCSQTQGHSKYSVYMKPR